MIRLSNKTRGWCPSPGWVLGVAAVAALLAQPSAALVVMNQDPSDNYLPPTTATNPGAWGANVDPGWSNSTTNGVYLGNGWVLTAKHTIGNKQTNLSEQLNGDTYAGIDNSVIHIRNPNHANLTTYADLALFRLDTLEINGQHKTAEQRAAELAQDSENPIPAMRQVSLAGSTLSHNTQLMLIANGQSQGTTLLHAERDSSGSWTESACSGSCWNHTSSGSGVYHAIGYSNQGTERLTWGTNRVDSYSNLHVTISNSEQISLDGTNYRALPSGQGDTLMQFMDFDTYNFSSDDGGNEANGSNLDSGSGIYAWNTSTQSWELGGLMHSTVGFSPGNRTFAVKNGSTTIGDITVFTDISVYKDQIEAYMAPPEGYEWTGAPGEDTRFFSLVDRQFRYDEFGDLYLHNEGLWGDINLDGDIDDDDIDAFISGWGHEQQFGDIFSWKQGDLNQDGLTDLQDFLLLRSGFQGTSGASLNLSALLAGSGNTIPEPSAMLLLAGGTLGVLAWRGLRRSR